MKKNKLNLESFLKKLLEACSHDDAYSVIEICSFFNVSYEELKKLAAEDEKYLYILEMCHLKCQSNAEMAGLMSRIPSEEAFKYIYENN